MTEHDLRGGPMGKASTIDISGPRVVITGTKRLAGGKTERFSLIATDGDLFNFSDGQYVWRDNGDEEGFLEPVAPQGETIDRDGIEAYLGDIERAVQGIRGKVAP